MKEFEVSFTREVVGNLTVRAETREQAEQAAQDILDNNAEHNDGDLELVVDDDDKVYAEFVSRYTEIYSDDATITDVEESIPAVAKANG